MTGQRIFALLWLLLCSTVVTAQVRPELNERILASDYTGAIEKIERYTYLTNDETIAAIKTYYRLGHFNKAHGMLDQFLSENKLPQSLERIHHDLKKNQSSEMIDAPHIDVSIMDYIPDASSFASLIVNDSIFLSRAQIPQSAFKERDNSTGKSFLALYKAHYQNGSISNHALIDKKKSVNIGPIARFQNGYVVTTNFSDRKSINKLKLVFLDSSFNKVEEFPFNSAQYSLGHACYDSLKSRLVFVSDMPLGNGETDIWTSDLIDGEWQQPKRLNKVNSPGNEMFPTIEGNTLYFSSNGRDGYGALDIYSTSLDDADTIINHLPYPINSRADDFGYLSVTKYRTAIINSNRSKDKTDHVYEIKYEDGTFDCTEECLNEACRQFTVGDFDKISQDHYRFLWDFGDGEKGEGMFISHCYKEKGSYLVKLSVENLATNEVEKDVMSDLIQVDTMITNYPHFEVENGFVGTPLILTDSIVFNSGDQDDVLWETSEGFASMDKKPSISFKTSGFHWIKRSVKFNHENNCCYNSFKTFVYIQENEVASTSSGQNATLSEDSVSTDPSENTDALYQATVFVEKANPLDSLSFLLVNHSGDSIFSKTTINDSVNLILDHKETYSFIATNEMDAKTSITINSSAKTEQEYQYYYITADQLKLGEKAVAISVIDEQGMKIPNAIVKVGNNQFKTNASGVLYVSSDDTSAISVKANGYWSSIDKTDLGSGQLSLKLTSLESDSPLTLNGIQFDTGRHNIKKEAANILDEIYKTLFEHPEISIELSAHTDSRGRSTSNQQLSERRALSAKAYLEKKGIRSKRIIAKGYGETRLANHCSDGVECSEELHQENRRIVITILKNDE